MASWKTLENWAYMTSFLAAKAVPMAAAGSSVVFAVSPWSTVKTIQRTGSTLQFPFAPFFFFFVQSVIYTLYSYATADIVMGTTTSLSMVLGLHYVYVYCKHANDRTRHVRYVITSLTLILFLALHALRLSPKEAQLLIGIPGNILSLLTSSSPLLQVPTILRTRDASCLPYGMAVMNVVAGTLWMLYGLMQHDPLIICPNLFALTMGVIQVGLILRFPSPSSTQVRLNLPGVKGTKAQHEKV